MCGSQGSSRGLRGGDMPVNPGAGGRGSLGSAPLPADLDEALARAASRFGRLGSPLLYFPCIGSTNDMAASLAAGSGREGALVIADEQTAGRGRHGRRWFSPPGSGLYVSVVLAPGRARRDRVRATLLLTLAAGTALAEGIEAACGLRVDIKWPNDLYAGRRKLAGILAETVTAGDPSRLDAHATHVVLGYGINVAPAAYPPELRDRATSLESELGRQVERSHLLVETMAALARRYDDLLEGRFDAILDAWRVRAPASRGAHVTWTSAAGLWSGVTAGVDDEGALLVKVGDTVERIVGGEIRWVERS